ncbi:MAG: crosslink repair DNA glycosylase YcaQ family protein, partial [Pseudomonadota bacterium]
ASAREMGYLQKKNIITGIEKEIQEMWYSGELVKVFIEGIEGDYYAMPEGMEGPKATSSKVHILSPFDNFVIQRQKLQRFFDFDYQIECYVPERKRKYGYFTLPVFQGAKALGRIDCKVDRTEKVVSVQSLHCEHNFDKDWLKSKMTSKLRSFVKFNNCTDLEYSSGC